MWSPFPPRWDFIPAQAIPYPAQMRLYSNPRGTFTRPYGFYSSPCGPLSPIDGVVFQPGRSLMQPKWGYIPALVVHLHAYMRFIPAHVVFFPP